MNVLEIKKLSKKYGDFKALDEVSLTVKKGDIYGLVGRNGAGKTTLFKAVLGLTNQIQGDISINESKSNDELLNQRKTVGFLIGQSFFSYLNAHQNIEYYRRLKGIKDKSETERVLKIVGLHGVDKPFSKYSMGMKQRLGIANAILGNPDIVILDEPINGLDPQGILDIRKLLTRLNKEYGMTLVVSSHILSELELVANRFGIIDKGVLIKEISKENYSVDNLHYIILNTSDNPKAKDLLMNQKQLKIEETSVGLKIVKDSIENYEIVEMMVTNNVRVNEIYEDVNNLESMYFELTGGVA